MQEHPYIDPNAILWSAPVAADKPLLVLLHGWGSDEADLFGLVPFLPPELVVASVRAPLPQGSGFAWYRRETDDPDAHQTDVDLAARSLLDWLDSLPSMRSVGLLGFSQGGAMSLQLMRYRPHAFSYVVQLSGFLLVGNLPGDAELTDLHMPVFWGRGTHDTVISRPWVEQTAEWLATHANLQEQLYPTGHSITEEELVDISAFLGTHLVNQ